MSCHTFDSSQELVQALSEELRKLSSSSNAAHIALSGGSTPKQWFKYLAESQYRDQINWANLHFWWVDERFVETESPESNFGESKRLLWDQLEKSELRPQLHPFEHGDDIEISLANYQKQLEQIMPFEQGYPVFDWIVLGVGEDGHTASLFPGQTDYAFDQAVLSCLHPESKQPRLTLSANTIGNAKRATYVLTGASKAEIFKQVGPSSEPNDALPASKVRSVTGTTDWFIDAQVINS